MNLKGFEFGALDQNAADRQPPNGSCADCECANCDRPDRRGNHGHAAE